MIDQNTRVSGVAAAGLLASALWIAGPALAGTLTWTLVHDHSVGSGMRSLRGLALDDTETELYGGFIQGSTSAGYRYYTLAGDPPVGTETATFNVTDSANGASSTDHQGESMVTDDRGLVYGASIKDSTSGDNARVFILDGTLATNKKFVLADIDFPGTTGETIGDMAFRRDGSDLQLYVTRFHSGSAYVERYSIGGTGVADATLTLDTSFNATGQYSVPSASHLRGIDVADDGTIFIASRENDAVYRISADLTTVITETVTEAMDVALFGVNAYVTQYDGATSAIVELAQADLTPTGDTFTATGTFPHDRASTGYSAIDIDSTGRIFLADQIYHSTLDYDRILVSSPLAGPPEIENLDTGEFFASLQPAIDDPDTLDGHTLEVIVPVHTTPETQIHVTKSVTIQGGSPDTLMPSADTGSSGDARGWFLIDFGKTVTFRDLIFDGTGFKIWNAIRSHGTLTVEDCEFTEIKFEESGPAYSGVGVVTFDATGSLTVTDTTFSEIGRIGIHIFGPAVVERCTYTGKGAGDWLDYFMCVGSFGTSIGMADIENCTSTDCVGVATVDSSTSAGMLVTTFFGPGTEAIITGSSFHDNTTGIAVGFDASDTSTVVANFNNIFDNDFGMVNTSTSTVVDAKFNWWGDPGGPDDPPGIIPAVNGVCADVVDIFNVNPSGDSVTDLNVCYCPWSETLITKPTEGSLTLEIVDCPDDAFTGESGYQIAVEVWMRDLTGAVTGFQAFIEFDDAVLSYRGDLSSYTSDPFPLHIQAIATAEVAAGEIRIDGSDDLGDPGTVLDSLLATLVFDVDTECVDTAVDFDLTQAFDSELSFEGDPVTTTLVNTGDFTLDDTPPSITCPADITQAADADVLDGCTSAIVTYTATATDNCDGAIIPVCDFPSGTAFPVGTTTVTCTATDACGNESECMFDVTVTATNVVCLDVQLVGVTTATTRCIHFVADDCSETADIDLAFDGTGLFSGEIEIPCGNWTQLCAKDEQHTLWDTASLTLSGAKYVASTTLDLLAGDNDNDGDVDINDVTFLVATFGDAALDGDCPFDGTRDADYSNNGAVAAEDYSLLTPNWLSITACACTIAPPSTLAIRVDTDDLEPWIAERADLLRDGVIDWRDVHLFERQHGLPHALSEAMKWHSQ